MCPSCITFLTADEKHILLLLFYRPGGPVFFMLSSAEQIVKLVSPNNKLVQNKTCLHKLSRKTENKAQGNGSLINPLQPDVAFLYPLKTSEKLKAIEGSLKVMKSAFYFILKALFTLKIFKFLS